MFIRLLLFTLFLSAMNVFSQTPTIETGVPQTLAKWRAANYSDVRYKLNLTLEKDAPLMKGEIEIRVKLTDEGARNDLILDWRTTQFANDKDKPYANVVGVNDAPDILHQIASEHIRIPKGLLKKGENIVKIQFASPIKKRAVARQSRAMLIKRTARSISIRCSCRRTQARRFPCLISRI